MRLFTDASDPHSLGYDYLGDWQKREANSGIEVSYLKRNLDQRGYSSAQVSAALQELQKAADITRDSLYQANRSFYQLLRYGIKVKVAIDKEHETVYLIDWDNVDANHFALAEEVTLRHGSERRPDIVLYINGLAIAVMELKRGSVNVNNAIQQLRTNQEEQFNAGFFSTVQYLFAGSDAQGLRYGTTGTDTKYFLSWKQGGDAEPSEGYLLDQPLMQMCQKERLLDLIRNCIIFDAGIKKVPREHQYHGLKKTQDRIEQRQGGVIWHTQGSGKSIFMVMLTQWLLENDPAGRVLIITDRDELDKQIEGVMRNTGVLSDSDAGTLRIQSREEFEQKLTATTPRLLCALIHKFNPDLDRLPPKAHGRFYVLVDECHRTQGGNMNKQMK